MSTQVRGRINETEMVDNQDRRFGSWAGKYYLAMLVGEDGNERPLLLTESQIQVALERAAKNPEDIQSKPCGFWDRLIGNC